MSAARHTPGPWILDRDFLVPGAGSPAGIHQLLDLTQGTLVGKDCDIDAVGIEMQANRRLIEAAPALLAQCEKALRFLIAERDCHYDSVTDADGNYHDDEDRMAVEQYDHDIDELQTVIDRAEGRS